MELDVHLRRFGNCAATVFHVASSVLGELEFLKRRSSRRGSQMDPGLAWKTVSPSLLNISGPVRS